MIDNEAETSAVSPDRRHDERPTGMTVIDRSAARARILTRFRDEAAGPPRAGDVAVRCTKHSTFIIWTNPPAPECVVACPDACQADLRGCEACRVIGPLLTAPGTSGRSWRCECGEVWADDTIDTSGRPA